MTRASFHYQSNNYIEVGKNLGLSEKETFFRIILPSARPAIFAGLALVSMECISDFGTVSFFSINTLTTGIYNSWLTYDDLNTANQISFILLLFVLFLFSIEIYSRNEARYHQPSRGFKPINKIKLNGKKTRLIAVEPAASPSLTKGKFAYDFGDAIGMTPLMKMHTLGHQFIPEPIHAGGLRYHGMAPLVSHVYDLGLVEATSVPQTACFEAAVQFARSEGIVPAPEPTHAIAAAIDAALKCKETGDEKVILTALCGHGHLDLPAYEKFLSGEITDLDLPEESISESMKSVPNISR